MNKIATAKDATVEGATAGGAEEEAKATGRDGGQERQKTSGACGPWRCYGWRRRCRQRRRRRGLAVAAGGWRWRQAVGGDGSGLPLTLAVVIVRGWR